MAKYADFDKIGSGGFGVVTKCKRDIDNKIFAKKKLHSKEEDAIKRFAREVRLISSLDHPNVVKIVAKKLTGNTYWYAMPLYSHSLRDIIKELHGNYDRIHQIFSSVLDGIEYAHSQGVIHRDLKPENVLMNDDSNIVISDFGLGRMIDAVTSRKTQSGIGFGTLGYVAPEQTTDLKNSDHRADIFSLGRILYEMCSGTIFGIQDISNLPLSMGLIITKCTKQDPNERYKTVTELKQDWKSLFDIQSGESEAAEFALLRVNPDISSEGVEKLISHFAKIASEDDLHEFLMSTHVEVFAAIYNRDVNFARQIISRYAKFTEGRGWGWGYTDKIGNWCECIFNRIDDSNIRVDLAMCVGEVGRSHNRWKVLGIFSKMMSYLHKPDEIFMIKNRIKDLNVYKRKAFREYARNNVSEEILSALDDEEEPEWMKRRIDDSDF
jgi:tRNA A-37 threonylcarbamoyl transferase component Bud32